MHSSRLASIDCFRGFAVLAMVTTSYLTGMEALLASPRHAPDGRFTVGDLAASCLDSCFETKEVASAS